MKTTPKKGAVVLQLAQATLLYLFLFFLIPNIP